ncbi:hypothetical protein FQ330_02550 [Agrococcus sediminis]|uniref:Uncharacterized protein n=1 Tax=Agrococcus sediminis TaxID=2599924 RepID=A0A5M8QJH6_9MICO|nr:hypothetical protein [Agrococcus sediminis]KAA6436307.1 hypothetical protein FQ330_02550 [Agrococcus sediminis]
MHLAAPQHAAPAAPARVPAGMASVGAALAALLLPLASLAMRAPEGAAELLWVAGWACAAWAAIAAVSAVVLLVRERTAMSRRTTRTTVQLIGFAVALLAVTAWLHPFAGSGGGAG